MFANDGSYISSYLTNLAVNTAKDSFEDFSLRIGTVVAVYPPNSDQNSSKRTTEYDVQVDFYSAKNGGVSKITYYRIPVQSLFGGVGDYSDWTLRVGKSGTDSLGSRVLILCNNGNQTDAYIIGGVRHPQSKIKDPDFEGNHRFITEFNGVNQTINNDGELKILRRGATKDDGNVKDSTNSGALIYLNKDGQIQIGYQDSIDSDFSSIVLNKSTKILSLFSKDKMLFKTEKTAELTTTDGFKINPLNPDQQAFVRGTAYRNNEKKLHTELSAQIQTLAGLITATATSIGVAGASNIAASPLLLVPVAGAMAASAPVAAAGAALTAATQALTQAVAVLQQMLGSIQSFEAQSNIYISTKHSFGDTP